MTIAPAGLEEVKAFYGDPTGFIREDGTISPFWELRMVSVELPRPLPLGWDHTKTARAVRVNEAIAAEVAQAFRELDKHRLWDFLVTYDGGYCWRTMRGSTSRLSMHAFGGALDFNASTNQMGTVGNMAPELVEFFEARGWVWGGSWKRPDPMHFQLARNY